ncbi:ABC transporter ATP-binding protein [Sphingomonas sp.]|uniref:ABC transporter ATP-binding protein n=1 Tax=Sphingomonas sp. TaxID=28214 RepID=UPI00286CFA3D|nr:ABC transporter ATP-binding protein [Sphingomonas sp.]
MTSLAVSQEIAIMGRLSPTDLSVEPGHLVAVIGPNGGGKTSLLRAMARTEDAGGAVFIDGHDLDSVAEAGRRRLVAFMPASRETPWPIRVVDFIQLGLGTPDPARLDHLVTALELAPLTMRPIDRLSTGERARAMLARALAGKARLLLLDEPLSNLDPYWVLRTIELLRAEIADKSRSAMVSVHDLGLIKRFDRVLLVTGGVVVGDGTPADVLASDAFGAAFRIEPDGAGWAIRPVDRQSLR